MTNDSSQVGAVITVVFVTGLAFGFLISAVYFASVRQSVWNDALKVGAIVWNDKVYELKLRP